MTISGTGPIGTGTDTVLWITAAIMILANLYFVARMFSAPEERRHFFYASGIITLIAATMYMAMGSGYGSFNQTGVNPTGVQHLFFFGRYIDWVFTTPLLLLDLVLIALPRNFPGRNAIIWTMIGADVYMILTGIAATAIRSNFRWAFYGVSCAAFLAILYFIFAKLIPEATRRGPQVRQLFTTLSGLLIVLWVLYPIVWALGSEGFGVISLLAETICYAVLDVLAKVAFGFILTSRVSTLTEADEEMTSISPTAVRA
jgi:bacteriorhodopsin